MFNPRLASGDVGIGVNVRELRKNFTSTFNITYSLFPIGNPSGSVFRKYPAPWQTAYPVQGIPRLSALYSA
eukprot:1015120-Pyramimonas_sp.AAC.1